MMKRWLITAAAFSLLVSIGCGEQVQTFNDALDKDREAREKMLGAFETMREIRTLAESGVLDESAGARASADAKKQEAFDAYLVAIQSWDEAEQKYRQLIAEEPGNADYLNNLANMFYVKAKSGLQVDTDEAQRLLTDALAINEREIYKRNLDMLLALQTDPGMQELIHQNQSFIDEFKSMEEQKKLEQEEEPSSEQ